MSTGAGHDTFRASWLTQGGTLTFRNLDSPVGLDPALSIDHTITACQTPGNLATGIACPIANATTIFDSGELGYGPRSPRPPPIGSSGKRRRTSSGTHTYFRGCIHS